MDISDDNQSVYKHLVSNFILANKKYSMILFGRFDTTSYAIGSTLYFPKKYPKAMDKLIIAIGTQNLVNINVNSDKNVKDKYESWDYLNYVMKTLRIWSPAMSRLHHITKQDVKI